MTNNERTLSRFAGSVLILALAAPFWSCAQAQKTVAAENEAILRDQQAKSSYALGVEMGTKLKELALDAESVARGVQDGMTGAETLLTEAEMQALLATLRTDYRMKQQETLKQQRAAAGKGVLARIRFAFKPDPSLSLGTYAAVPAWVSPLSFSGVSGQDTVQVMAGGLDATGQPVPITPTWTAADSDLIEISPGEGNVAEIKVKRAGESTVEVTAGDISKKLSIKAEDRAGVIIVQMTQEP